MLRMRESIRIRPVSAALADTALADDDRAFVGHPVGLAYLAFMEAFERFSFYGMQALLVLYMTRQLLLPGHVENIAGFPTFRAVVERAEQLSRAVRTTKGRTVLVR